MTETFSYILMANLSGNLKTLFMVEMDSNCESKAPMNGAVKLGQTPTSHQTEQITIQLSGTKLDLVESEQTKTNSELLSRATSKFNHASLRS